MGLLRDETAVNSLLREGALCLVLTYGSFQLAVQEKLPFGQGNEGIIVVV